jgi:MscS family membrane protein
MDSLNDYLFVGRGLGDWLLAFAWVAGGFLVGKLVALFSRRVLRRVASRTMTKVDDLLLAVIERPLVIFLGFAGLRVGIGFLEPSEAVALFIGHAWATVLAFLAAWALVRVLDAIADAWVVPLVSKTEGTLDDQLLPILRKGGKTLIWGLATLVAIKHAGYDVGALLAGLGIGGIAVALAAQGTLTNLFGSLAIFVDRPFHLGDRIKVSGFDGNVIEIGLRTSRLRTLENRVVTIPNATFASSPIENVSSQPSVRVLETFDLLRSTPAADVERALAAIVAAAGRVEGLAEGSAASFSGFSDWGLRLTYVFYMRTDVDYWATLSAANLAALRALEEAGVSLAQPPRVTLESPQK